MRQSLQFNFFRWLLVVAALAGLVEMLTLTGATTATASFNLAVNIPATSMSQDWADLITGFALLTALGLGLCSWWFMRRVFKFK